MKPTYEIDKWKISLYDGYYRLEGFIKGKYPEILPYEPAYTSKLIKIDFDKCIAETINSVYILMKQL